MTFTPAAAAIPARQRDTFLVTRVLYTRVYGPNGAIGEIEDILVKSDGTIEGLVVSVAGFPAFRKKVALRMDQFKVMPEADGRARISVSATEDELRNAPEFNSRPISRR
jgi:hypothetical protein